MEKKIVVSKRFRKNTLKVYKYLLAEYSPKTAFNFLDKLKERVELIIEHPDIGKPSQKKTKDKKRDASTTQQNLL